ncbi:MAG: insulinase family protein [Okeania sp. SIO2G4]|uniref:M16 family metallopeptidase n=1 Tax=unclassified Okeania TaxID=2634635 RepID=UPI0013B7EF0B|nr:MULTISPECIES: pitrilysin family protein [unclassified Okeania]NEP03945.1 insulinase family protein [Okeania sp. SIO4D6]NEP73893.1 insulinase family protein [Okeania sp. SIO2G5]NEP94706.1 insulinase family protein [Okeania sp. SIO2F5]NEQ92431.1 insulinase family protein [Okeania sp. SIO2G4]
MTSTLVQPTLESLNAPTIHQLPNGLTIIAEYLPVEAVNLNIWLNVGSAVESEPINGMAHFLEHIIFKGTPKLRGGEFERLVEQQGAVMNAATSQDYTHFYITTAPKDFAKLAPLQWEVLLNASIADDPFERERSVVLEEIRRSDDNLNRRCYRKAIETAFEKLPYRRPVLGPAEVVSQLQPQQMRDFHQTWYQPGSMTATVVGNLPVEELIDIVASSFTEAQNSKNIPEIPPLPPTNNLTPEQPFTKIVRHEVVDEALQQARLMMLWRVPGLTQLHETYALDVLATILSRGKTSRLVRDLREERGLVYSIGVSNMSHRHQGVFYISARLPEENLAEVEAAIAHHIHTIQQESVTETEIQRIRTLVANRFIFANETPSDRANLYGYYHSIVGDLAPALSYPQHIQALDSSDIQQAASKYLSVDAYGVIAFRPK